MAFGSAGVVVDTEHRSSRLIHHSEHDCPRPHIPACGEPSHNDVNLTQLLNDYQPTNGLPMQIIVGELFPGKPIVNLVR